MNLVYRHRSGGELWQGGIDDVRLLLTKTPDRIRTVGLFAQEIPIPRGNPNYELLCLGYDDNFSASGPEVDQIKKIADHASDRLADRLRTGRSVLSSCAMGFNRSGLVTAVTLIKLGVDPGDAVNMVRQARGPRALSNPAFMQIVREMAHTLGIKETWTRWIG